MRRLRRGRRTPGNRRNRRQALRGDSFLFAFQGTVRRGLPGRATRRNDLDQNKELYGKPVTNKEVIGSNMAVPDSAQPLIAQLNKYSFHEAPRGRERFARDQHGRKR